VNIARYALEPKEAVPSHPRRPAPGGEGTQAAGNDHGANVLRGGLANACSLAWSGNPPPTPSRLGCPVGTAEALPGVLP
jgi:hypothetical protein